ncbi:MAG: translocation/assembly module TamB domain-containing protein [Caulobacteraceae bacterium]
MTDAPTPPDAQPPAEPKSPETKRRRLHWFKPHTPLQWLVEFGLVVLLAAGLLGLAIRVAPFTPEVRQFIQARVQGLEIGSYGKLHVEGLSGDLWSDFTLRKVTVADQQGVWIEADNLRVRWRYAELLWRRMHVSAITADRLALLRQPIAKAQKKPPGKPLGFAYAVDRIHARVELAPAFSVVQGVYDTTAGFSADTGGPLRARLDAQSLVKHGDHFTFDLALGPKDALKLDADAKESGGGALAGVFGFDPAQPFDLTAHVSGTLPQGKVRAVAHSGALTPVDATGAWGRNGGGLSAHLLLGASRWTHALVKGFGPEAELAIISKPGSDKKAPAAYNLDVRFITANIVIIGKGPFDLAKRASLGMDLGVAVNDLHQLTPAPQMAAGRASGTIAGSLADLRFSGALEAHDLELWGWKLQKAAGPVKVNWKKGELEVQGDLTGSGGSGGGAIAEAGGAQPTASVDVMRLKDGRILIKSLSAVGRGLRLQGTGGQNPLFKGLSFNGALQVSDLAQLAPGTHGGLEASWSASQDAGPGQPWVFNAEGRGKGLSSGTPEIDRLMGPEPKLALAAQFQDGAFDVSRAEIEGAKERATAKGRWALAGDLNFDLDWAAEGPFGFGPLEVDGKASGAGKLTGMLAAPRLELAASFGQIAFPQLTVKAAKLDLVFQASKSGGSDGQIALSGQSDYGPARARSDFRFLEGGLDLNGIDADAGGIKAKGALSLRDGAPSSADLTVAIGPGALISEGAVQGVVKIADARGGAGVNIDMTGKGVVVRGQPLALANARVRANGPLDKLHYQVTADGAWLRTPVKVDGSGVVAKDPKGISATFNGSGTLRRAPFSTEEPASIVLDQGDQSARFRLALGGGRARVDARQTGSALNLDAAVSGVDLSFLSEDFTGGLDASVTLQGQGADLHGAFDAALKNARSRDARKGLSIDGQIKGALQGGRLQLALQLGSEQGLTSKADLALPVAASAAPFRLEVLKDRPLQGDFQADGQIQPLWDLFLGGERTLGGKLAAKIDIGGTPGDPKLTGRADLTEGLFDDYATGLKLRQVALGAALNTDSITIDRFSGADSGKGRVTGSGQVSLARGGGGDLILNLTGFRLIDNDTAQADATGLVTLTRAADGKAKLSGTLQIDRGDVNAAARTGPNIALMEVVEKNRPFSLEDQLAPPSTQPQSTGIVDLDVYLKAARGILIKGRGLDVDLSMDARVTGTTARPVLSGQARVVRGDYDFAGKRFEFDNRGTVTLSTDPSQIRLDLTATRQDPSITAVIRIQGTAAKPQISLSSTPILPNDEVLAQVLFGSSAAQLSPLEAAQLASALSALASGGGFDVVGNIRSFARLDRLAITGGNAATGFGVAGGKYLTENVYVEVSGGARTGASAQVEYRVTRNLSIVSKINDQIVTQAGQIIQGGDELSVRWRHDFTDKKNAPPPARREPSRPLPAQPQAGGASSAPPPQTLPH